MSGEEEVRIGERVRQMRGEMTQREVAEQMRESGWKWSQATVWAIESGARPLRLSEAAELVDIIGGDHVGDLLLSPGMARAVRGNRERRDSLARLGEAVLAAARSDGVMEGKG